nr:hypothetical protein BaRGS_008335 [Batillaria attramentaria]
MHVTLGATPDQIIAAGLHSHGKSLVLAGGGLNISNTEVWNTIVNLAGGKGQARIGIVTSASGDPNDSIQYNTDILVNRYGAAAAVHVNVSIWDSSFATSPTLVSQIRTLTGFYFSGGDQSRVVQSMYLAGRVETPVLAAIREQFEKGAVISGSSAGTACQPSAVMVTAGHSWEALKDGAKTSSGNERDLTYDPLGGIGFLDGYAIDTHFAARGREGRMIRLLSDTKHLTMGTPYGFGVGENTALVVTHAGTPRAEGKVLGEHGVTFFDLSSSFVDTSQRYFSIRDVYMTYLTHGDVYNLHTHDVTFSPDKTPLKGHENYDHALSTDDVFYGKSNDPGRKPEFVRAATSIFDARLDTSTYGTTYEKNPRFRVEMSRAGRDAVGYVKRVHDFHSDLHSYKDMYVAIHED